MYILLFYSELVKREHGDNEELKMKNEELKEENPLWDFRIYGCFASTIKIPTLRSKAGI
jgi:hypothetical protein